MSSTNGVGRMAIGPQDAGRSVPDESWSELVRRTVAIAHGTGRPKDDLRLPEGLAGQVRAAERRALALARAGGSGEQARRAAALEFLASVVIALRLAGADERDDARSLVSDAAAAIGVSRGAASLLVFMRAVAAPDIAQLPPESAIGYVLDLLVELGPAEGVSLWRTSATGRLECLAGAGEAATTRRLRGAARELLESGRPPADSGSHVRAVPVERWDRPFAALVARTRPEATARLLAYLGEAAAALSPVFEREMLFERNAIRERALASACERWGARFGCDLHDGPLQEIVALAEELRHARRQVASRVAESDLDRVAGLFDDLEARLTGLDRSLRDISQAARPTSALDQPLEQALRNEVEVFDRKGPIAGGFAVDGDVSTLTSSQRIVLFRVLQEALANARKHSEAARVDVRLKATSGYVSVTVSDNGRGFDPEQAKRKGRLGLSGVTERVRLLGGDVEIRSDDGHGTHIRATLPRWTQAAQPETSADYAVAP